MVLDPRFAFLSSYRKYRLELDEIDGQIYIVAILKKGMGHIFDKPDDAKFNLSSHIGVRDGSLVWGLSGFEADVSSHDIWFNEHTKERFLRVKLSGLGPDEPSERKLNLDDRVDIVEYYDTESREFRRRLGLKPDLSKRSIVLCFDGTSNHFSNQNTNVVKMVELLKKDDPSQQMVYYQACYNVAGVGTYAPPGLMTSVGLHVAAKADEGVAWFLYQHVIDGYKYLMQTYQAGDQISIFGFSRGAYTARALAGMIHSVGLLPKDNMEQVPFAYQIYERSKEVEPPELGKTPGPRIDGPGAIDVYAGPQDEKQSVKESARPENVDPERFKIAFCIPIQITFLGVWDTVGSVGALKRKTLPWIEYNPSVQYFRQALALDETRGNFIPSVWDHSRTKTDLEQSALEVWFKGGHADVGGGAEPTPAVDKHNKRIYDEKGQPERSRLLSNISLRWMVDQCLKSSGVRILFDPDSMRRYRNVKILEQRRPGLTDDEIQELIAELDDFDVVQRPWIALEKSLFWWILDCLPVPKLSQIDSIRSNPKTVRSPNMGSARFVNRQKDTDPIRLHASVYSHIKSDPNYIPAAEWYNWPKGEWPDIEGGTMSSMLIEGDEETEDVRQRLIMGWRESKKAPQLYLG
ncbi:unnamed protein product [Rhizoctonia solani]|uniref:T6SS Phospholipase effector Tle1-like catalytic domain-containing protein n=1 Tax=Rhizoctonia solani TaxID=456999 RepID=A0A8H3AS76_9AGAM|nr:unnamed protein product [Rhizoctonia solani]